MKMTSSNSRTIGAAVLTRYGVPTPGDFPAPADPTQGTVIVRVAAAAVNGLDRAMASGRHFLSPRTLPVVAGRDGVGATADGRLVYFDGPVLPYGAMAQETLVAESSLIEVPEGADVAVAAALGNAGLAAWLPLSWRAALRPGETVAVLGAGGVVGSLAVQAARHLGAGTVVGVVRGAAAVAHAKRLGADIVIDTAASNDPAADLKAATPDGLDVVVDYLWGDVAVAALRNARLRARFVQVGTVVSDEATLSGADLRSRSIDVLGYVSAHAPLSVRAEAYRQLVTLAMQGKLEIGIERYPLDAVAAAWAHKPHGVPTRAVLTIAQGPRQANRP